MATKIERLRKHLEALQAKELEAKKALQVAEREEKKKQREATRAKTQKEKVAARKLDTRRKILLGGFVLAKIKQNDAVAQALYQQCAASLSKPHDLKAFGLEKPNQHEENEQAESEDEAPLS